MGLYCEKCGELIGKVQEVGKALGHDLGKGTEKKADCAGPDRVEYTCKRCGETVAEAIEGGEAAKEHDWEAKIVPATCKTKGYEARVCKACGKVEKDKELPIDENAHVAKLGKVIREATCTTNGLGRSVCELCDKELGYITIKAGHKYGDPICDEGKQVTCGKAGYGYYVCTVCGEETEKAEIPATGKHTFVDETDIPATCTEPEKIGRICKVCGAADGEVEEIGEALGHDWDDGVYTKADCLKAEREVLKGVFSYSKSPHSSQVFFTRPVCVQFASLMTFSVHLCVQLASVSAANAGSMETSIHSVSMQAYTFLSFIRQPSFPLFHQ